MNRPRSLQARLAIQLILLYAIGATGALAAIALQGRSTATELEGRALSEQARTIADHVERDAMGRLTVRLPPELASSYAGSSATHAYAVRTLDGTLIGASDSAFGDWAARDAPPAKNEPVFFHLDRAGPVGRDLAGLVLNLETSLGPLIIAVAAAPGVNEFVHAVLREFVFDIAWILPAVLAVTLVIAILVVRRGLRPVRDASALAQRIEPSAFSIRLPENQLPSEVAPLAVAVNRALDRLQQGFEAQRAFTANAAHELRTPLSIITAALDQMHGNGELENLRADVARMNRLVDQLLRVARLDALALDTSNVIDLRAAVEQAVVALAPWTVAHGRALALAGATDSVLVRGDTAAIEDAVRNVIENAVQYAPENSEVVVDVNRDGAVRVADRGPGVPATNRARIFERFWRGPDAQSHGAGLGLSIVRAIMDAHGGEATIEDNPGGGALFRLQFRRAEG